MNSSTVIDLAVGVITGQNRCSQGAAMTILRAASNARNIKLREATASMLTSVGQTGSITTHFTS